jgi:hypothetical protein
MGETGPFVPAIPPIAIATVGRTNKVTRSEAKLMSIARFDNFPGLHWLRIFLTKERIRFRPLDRRFPSFGSCRNEACSRCIDGAEKEEIGFR